MRFLFLQRAVGRYAEQDRTGKLGGRDPPVPYESGVDPTGWRPLQQDQADACCPLLVPQPDGHQAIKRPDALLGVRMGFCRWSDAPLMEYG